MFASNNSPAPEIIPTEPTKPTNGALMNPAFSLLVPAASAMFLPIGNAVPAKNIGKSGPRNHLAMESPLSSQLFDPAPTLFNSPPRLSSLVHSASSTSPIDSPTASGKECKKVTCQSVNFENDFFSSLIIHCSTCSLPAETPTDPTQEDQFDDLHPAHSMPPANAFQPISDTSSNGVISAALPKFTGNNFERAVQMNRKTTHDASEVVDGHLKSLPLVAEQHLEIPHNAPADPLAVQPQDQAQEEFLCVFPSFRKDGEPIRIKKEGEKHCVRVLFKIVREVCLGAIKKLDGFERKRFDWRFGDVTKSDVWDSVQKNFDDLRDAIKEFYEKHPEENLIDSEEWLKETCTPAVAKKLLKYSYAMAIPDAKKLNRHYEHFSSEAYGEISNNQLFKIADHLKLKKDDVFVDLGTGVGNVVAFMSTQNIKLSAGIELCKIPANYADALREMLDRLLVYFSKKRGEIELHRGNFLDQEFRSLIIDKATVILINNEVFHAQLMNDIYEKLLAYIGDDVRVISVKEITSERTNNTWNRDLYGDFATRTTVTKLKGFEGGLSWTGNPATFFMAKVEGSKFMENFNRKAGEEIERQKAIEEQKRKTTFV